MATEEEVDGQIPDSAVTSDMEKEELILTRWEVAGGQVLLLSGYRINSPLGSIHVLSWCCCSFLALILECKE